MQDRKDEDLVYMFAYVNGFLEDATVDNAVIDVNGFGINVRISADTASRLPGIGEEVRLYTYTYVILSRIVPENRIEVWGTTARCFR